MFENLLDEVLTEYYAKELLIYSTVPEHKFSLKHRRAMKKMFARYKLNTKPFCLQSAQSAVFDFSEHRFCLTPKRLFVLVMVILFATLAGCAIDFEALKTNSSPIHKYIAFEDRPKISVKIEFDRTSGTLHFYNENNGFSQVKLNKQYSYFIDINDEDNIYTGILWDNGDCDYEIYGDFTREELFNLAKSNKISFE